MQDIEIHAHLWYVQESKDILDKVSARFNERINISLVKGYDGNKEILTYAKSKFKRVEVVYVDNMGNDQVGFIESYKVNTESKPWIFYIHDKADAVWTNELIDPIINCKNLEFLLQDHSIGMIGSKKKFQQAESEEYLAEKDGLMPMESKFSIVQQRNCLTWLRELQYILYSETGFSHEDKVNFKFFAGTMFLARKSIIHLAHRCVHNNFFEPRYSSDGKVEHGLERFYGYVNKCMNLEMRAI